MKLLHTGVVSALALVLGVTATQADAQSLRGFRAEAQGGITSFHSEGNHKSKIGWGAAAGVDAYLADSFVLGVEGDIDYTNLEGSHRFTIPAPSGVLSFKTEWQGSARLRAGYAIDNFLLYATGGLAFAQGKLTSRGVDDSNTHFGWTVGVGAEYAFTQNWIGRAEVRYSDFQKKSYDTPDGRVKAGWNQTTATVGISYKF